MAGQKRTETLDTYAGDLKQANEDLQLQTQYFETVRRACQILTAYEQNNSKVTPGLPIIKISNRENPDKPGIEIDLDQIGPASALTIKPFLEMSAGAIGASLQQSWGRVNQINLNAQNVLQVANQVQQQQQQ